MTVAVSVTARWRTLLAGTTVIVATAFGLCRTSGVVVKSFGAFAHDAASDETFESAEFAVIFIGDEADGIADGIRASGASDAMDVILDVHREIVVDHMRDAVHVNAARGDVCGHEHAHCARLEIFQRLQPLIL